MNRFYWNPSEVLQTQLAVIGNTTGGVYSLSYAISYEIGITPNLNWSDFKDIFTEYNPLNPFNSNALLFKKSNLSVDNGTAFLDSANNLIYIDLSEEEIQSIIKTNFRKYIWSVRALLNDGSYTAWSFPRSFESTNSVENYHFSINTNPVVTSFPVLKIHGTKDNHIQKIVVNSEGNLTEYNGNNWHYEYQLIPGYNFIFIKGINTELKETQIYPVSCFLNTGTQDLKSYFNSFDEFGSLYGIERLPEESNSSFKNRIKDVFIHSAESNALGLVNSITRELNLNYNDEAIIVFTNTIENRKSDELYKDLALEISTNKVAVVSSDFIVFSEHHKIDNQDWSIKTNYPVYHNFSSLTKVYNEAGQINNKDITFYDDRTIKISSGQYVGNDFWVTYCKKIEQPISGKTVTEAFNIITGLSYEDRYLFSGVLNISSGSSDGLLRGRYPVSTTSRYEQNGITKIGVPIKWSEVSIFTIHDKDFKLRFTGQFGDLLNSDYDKYTNIFREKAHRTIDKCILDSDVWDPIDENTENQLYIDSVLNPQKGYWYGDNNIFSVTEANDMSFICPISKSKMVYKGIKPSEFKSGIGDNEDLKVFLNQYNISKELPIEGTYKATTQFNLTGSISESQYFPDTVWGRVLFEP